MENTDRARERSQDGVVQSWHSGLNLNTDKLGASLHPPRPEPSSASSGTQRPQACGELGSQSDHPRGGRCFQPG